LNFLSCKTPIRITVFNKNNKMNCGDTNNSIDNTRQKSRNETVLGKYKFLRTLEKGKFGIVKLAKHIQTGEKVAIKIVDKSQLNSSDLKEILREADIIKTLDHPNIAQAIQIIDAESTFYLVMEYVSGGDLFSRLDLGKMEEETVREKFRQIVSAIRYCHEEKYVIHRDLKPENILFDSEKNIKITDFGLSEEFIPGVKLDTFCGTPEYMAPELFLGRTFDGPKVDIWSLGVILYEMLTDTVPFTGTTWQQIGQRVLRGKYFVPEYISTDCKNLLNKMLVLDPNDRATIDMILGDSWLSFGLEQENVHMNSPTTQMKDQRRLNVLIELGYKENEVEESLRCSKFDDCHATYILLGRKTRRRSPSQCGG